MIKKILILIYIKFHILSMIEKLALIKYKNTKLV